MRKAGKIPHIHLPHVSQSGFNAKVNVLTFGKLQEFFFLFSTFSILYNDYNIRPKEEGKKKKKRKKRGEGEVRTCFISVQRAKNWFP